MNKNLLFKAVSTLQLVMFILLPTIMFAPPIPPNPGGSTPVTPIDNGILLLLIAGLSYGVIRVLKTRKQLA
jgi:hypothetical protein